MRFDLLRHPDRERDRAVRRAVRALPWTAPLDDWRRRGVKHLRVRRGVGRHPLVFVESEGVKLVVKELGPAGARREIAVYRRLQELGIPSLAPVGTVVREEPPLAVATPTGNQFEANAAGHTVTLLAEHVLPESLLFPLGFSRENRRRIWDALLTLFVDLHVHGIYWGDASLANALIRFTKEVVPQVGKRTRLEALLADAETVEVRESLSAALRRADFENFLDSMRWLNEDLRLAGILREPRVTAEDERYLHGEYERRFAVAAGERVFSEATGLDVRGLLGTVRDAVYLENLRRHIDEHKWYLSERAKGEVPLRKAAEDWYVRVFLPVCELFRSEKVLDLFPGETASDLYVEVMTHKYFLSREQGRDVGMAAALRDYAERFGKEPILAAIWNRLSRKLVQILGVHEQMLLGGMQ